MDLLFHRPLEFELNLFIMAIPNVRHYILYLNRKANLKYIDIQKCFKAKKPDWWQLCGYKSDNFPTYGTLIKQTRRQATINVTLIFYSTIVSPTFYQTSPVTSHLNIVWVVATSGYIVIEITIFNRFVPIVDLYSKDNRIRISHFQPKMILSTTWQLFLFQFEEPLEGLITPLVIYFQI